MTVIRQVDLAWIALGVVEDRHERPQGDPALRVDRIRREVEKESRALARAEQRAEAEAARRRLLQPTRSSAF
jgi:hypothetical protein